MSSATQTIPKLKLSLTTPILFGVQLWLFIAVSVLVLALFFALLCLCVSRRRAKLPATQLDVPAARRNKSGGGGSSMDRRLLHSAEMEMARPEAVSDRWSGHGSVAARGSGASSVSVDMAARRGLSVFTAAEVEMATDGFAEDCVIGGGNDAVLYRGVLLDNRLVAVKRMPNFTNHGIRCEAEDLEVEMEGMGHVRHKNLVKLLGYSIEGPYRMLVYEYVENGNLHQWLHNSHQLTPLTWPTRIKIITGTAKGLAYLHEDHEPRIIHCDIKSSKILLDRQWNPKISGFALAKGSNNVSVVTSLLTVTSGYVAPEYASTGVLSEKTDVYSFGVLIMEIVSGRKPVDHSQPQKYLVDWLKSMVADQRAAHVVDTKLLEMPSSKELKRLLLVALRCVDPDANNRPKMSDVIHMLQPHDLLLSDENRVRRSNSCRVEIEESAVIDVPETGSS